MSVKDGGRAFPIPLGAGDDGDEWRRGMTLRDYFAGQALMGMHGRDSFDPGQQTPAQRAHLAYIDADAMLAERMKS